MITRVFSCPGREYFSILIISVLQNFQAKTQTVFHATEKGHRV